MLPHFEIETKYIQLGYGYVAGLDEVGRGCLAGPVVAAAVILNSKDIPSGINDSKKLSEKNRERLSKEIRSRSVAFAIAEGSVDEIDTINIFQSSKESMLRAVSALNPRPDFLLIDGNFSIKSSIRQQSLVGGDQISVSIAAASIVAKVYRDELMRKFDVTYPGYHFASNKGYGSRAHRIALEKQGPSLIHRKSFSWTPIRDSL